MAQHGEKFGYYYKEMVQPSTFNEGQEVWQADPNTVAPDPVDLEFWRAKAKKYNFTIVIHPDGMIERLVQPGLFWGGCIPVKEVAPGVWQEVPDEEIANPEETERRFYSEE